MAGSAETLTNTANFEVNQTYARSVGAIRNMGALTVRNSVGFEATGSKETVGFDNYVSALREMLKSDGEFRDRLDIDDMREYAVVDGKARDKEGTAILEIVSQGKQTSTAMALEQPEFRAQVVRDAGDEIIAQRVDELRPGESLFALSMEPKDELKAHKKAYTGLGYREGISFIQWYSRADDDTLVASSFSVDMSDEATWREKFAELGVTVPEGESPNMWIRHSFKRDMSPGQAEQFARDIRSDYYERRGATAHRHSVSEYVAANPDIVHGYFDAYYPALANAVSSGKNNEVLQDLAKTILGSGIGNLKGEIREHLRRVANGQGFDDDLGRTMDEVIRYAVVEELRKGLEPFVASGETQPAPSAMGVTASGAGRTSSAGELNMRMAQNVRTGVEAGRSYGGCSSVELDADDGDPENEGNPQEAFGGKLGRREKRTGRLKRGKCVVETCPTRPGETTVGGCGVCIGRCQKLFDLGKDPTKMGASGKSAGKTGTAPLVSVEWVIPAAKKEKADQHEFSLAA